MKRTVIGIALYPNYGSNLAEKEGFEPSIPFWGIHDFQSCALGQLRDFSICASALADLHIIHHSPRFVKRYFYFFQKFFTENFLPAER